MDSNTQKIVNGFYDGIQRTSGWQEFVSEDIALDGTGIKAKGEKKATSKALVRSSKL